MYTRQYFVWYDSATFSVSGGMVFAVMMTGRGMSGIHSGESRLGFLTGHRKGISCVDVSGDGMGACTNRWESTLKVRVLDLLSDLQVWGSSWLAHVIWIFSRSHAYGTRSTLSPHSIQPVCI